MPLKNHMVPFKGTEFIKTVAKNDEECAHVMLLEPIHKTIDKKWVLLGVLNEWILAL